MPPKRKRIWPYRPYTSAATVEQALVKRAKAQQYRKRNIEKVREWHSSWYQSNREAICERRRRHYSYNKASQYFRGMYLLAEACREMWEREFKWKNWGSGKVRIAKGYFRKRLFQKKPYLKQRYKIFCEGRYEEWKKVQRQKARERYRRMDPEEKELRRAKHRLVTAIWRQRCRDEGTWEEFKGRHNATRREKRQTEEQKARRKALRRLRNQRKKERRQREWLTPHLECPFPLTDPGISEFNQMMKLLTIREDGDQKMRMKQLTDWVKSN